LRARDITAGTSHPLTAGKNSTWHFASATYPTQKSKLLTKIWKRPFERTIRPLWQYRRGRTATSRGAGKPAAQAADEQPLAQLSSAER